MVKKILVIKLGGWADTVLSSFIAPALRENYPGAHITLLLGKSLSDWASCLHYDNVILVNDRLLYSGSQLQKGAESLSATLKIKKQGFDLGISLHDSWHFAALMKAGGVKKTIGFLREGTTSSYFGFDKTVMVRENISELERYLELLSALEIKPTKLNFKLKVRQGVHDHMMLRLAADGLRSQGFLAVGPGGGDNIQRKFYHKRWTYFSEFLRLFCQKTGLPILLLGGPSDRDLVEPLMHIAPGRIFSWVGNTTREESLSVIGESHAFVGCDSGLGHIAASVGVPSVILFGPTSSRTHYPAGSGKNVICLDAQVPCSPCHKLDGSFAWDCRDNVCMKSISPVQVWQALSTISGLTDITQGSAQPSHGK